MEPVDCDVAREALSARIDGEREQVPSSRVDEHLDGCDLCTAWYRNAREQSGLLRGLVSGSALDRHSGRIEAVAAPSGRRTILLGARCTLAAMGVIQLAVAVAQVLGVDFGLIASHHGAASGAHLLNESTAWSAALGIAFLATAIRPLLASGVACVAGVYAGVLIYYVVVDTLSGQVTAARVVSHLPVLLGALLALVIWEAGRPGEREGRGARTNQSANEPPSLSDRRRGQPRAGDGSAA